MKCYSSLIIIWSDTFHIDYSLLVLFYERGKTIESARIPNRGGEVSIHTWGAGNQKKKLGVHTLVNTSSSIRRCASNLLVKGSVNSN